MKKENYNPNSTKHNEEWHNDCDSEWEECQWKNKNVPRHRESYFWGRGEVFNETSEFLHKLDELPEEVNVPPEMVKTALNAIVMRLNRLTDERNSLEEYEFNKIKARKK
ncbi:hypothetical protein H8E06_00055 [bacterium]|nr:hypothetical protein [bacterium]